MPQELLSSLRKLSESSSADDKRVSDIDGHLRHLEDVIKAQRQDMVRSKEEIRATEARCAAVHAEVAGLRDELGKLLQNPCTCLLLCSAYLTPHLVVGQLRLRLQLAMRRGSQLRATSTLLNILISIRTTLTDEWMSG